MRLCNDVTVVRLSIYTTLTLLLLCICQTDAENLIVDNPMDVYEVDGFEMEDIPERKPSTPRLIHDNGMLHLVLHYLALKLIEEMEVEEETRFNERQTEMIQDKITGFYDDILSHPALQDSRVVFNPKVPHYESILPSDMYNDKEKRTSSGGPLTEVCESSSQWHTLRRGKNLNHQEVNLHHAQSFYVTSCVRQGHACSSMASGRASECRSRTSWMPAYLEDGNGGYTWSFIAINTCCSCAARES